MNRVTAYISVGSNLGDRAGNIHAALERLADDQLDVIRVSTLIENPAVGMAAGSPDFLNGAVEIATVLAPVKLLNRLLAVEQSLGRDRGQGWTPRTIDLDLLLYGSQVLHAPHLIVPHPRMHERGFVLQPLAEIAPDVIHPVIRQTIGELWRSFRTA